MTAGQQADSCTRAFMFSAGGRKSVSSRLFQPSHDVSVEDLAALCSSTTKLEDYPSASHILDNVPIYQLPSYLSLTEHDRLEFQDEFYRILLHGPGVFVVQGLYHDNEIIERVNETFSSIIQQESSLMRGDHFSADGGNQRIWDSFSKHAMKDPETFSKYYSNPWLALICESWLGPAYRITTQVNIVNPGGQPQVCHRDYHLGFQTEASCARYPRASQMASQLLTLQGAVAHSDMPLNSGPTRLLPFSQLYEPGYMAYRRPEFVEYFNKSWVAAPLEKGDGIFFNPALFHAAGENKTHNISRSANLLQVSSAFGKPMETIDTEPIIEKCWDILQAMYDRAIVADDKASTCFNALICAIADGYPFPTNLDRCAPRYGGLAPESEQELLLRCLKARHNKAEVMLMLGKMRSDAKA